MECDWEFDIGADAPVIDALWPGLVDLRAEPGRVQSLPEAAELPALADALVMLNGPESGVWTSKCDLWTEQEFDRDELDAGAADAMFSLACYIDVLPASVSDWATADDVGDWTRRARDAMRLAPLRNCRIDLVIRAAHLRNEGFDFGVTAYAIGCGASPEQSADALSKALLVFTQSVVALANGSKYNEKSSGE